MLLWHLITGIILDHNILHINRREGWKKYLDCVYKDRKDIMERAIRMLNLFTAVIMLVTGFYIQETFDMVLSNNVKTIIIIGMLIYFLLVLDQVLTYKSSNSYPAKE